MSAEPHVVIVNPNMSIPARDRIELRAALSSVEFEAGVVESAIRSGNTESALWHLAKLRRIARLGGMEGG